MKHPLNRDEFIPGRRVYVGDLDVFGRLMIDECINGTGVFVIVCEAPMKGYTYAVTEYNKPRIYDDAIENR